MKPSREGQAGSLCDSRDKQQARMTWDELVDTMTRAMRDLNIGASGLCLAAGQALTHVARERRKLTRGTGKLSYHRDLALEATLADVKHMNKLSRRLLNT